MPIALDLTTWTTPTNSLELVSVLKPMREAAFKTPTTRLPLRVLPLRVGSHYLNRSKNRGKQKLVIVFGLGNLEQIKLHVSLKVHTILRNAAQIDKKTTSANYSVAGKPVVRFNLVLLRQMWSVTDGATSASCIVASNLKQLLPPSAFGFCLLGLIVSDDNNYRIPDRFLC